MFQIENINLGKKSRKPERKKGRETNNILRKKKSIEETREAEQRQHKATAKQEDARKNVEE